MYKSSEKLTKETIRGFFPFLLTNLIPLFTLIIFGIFSSHLIFNFNTSTIENDKKQFISRISEVFLEAKKFDTQLNEIITGHTFPNADNLKVHYWGDSKYNDFHNFFDSYNEQRKYLKGCFVYLPETDSIISQRGIQSSNMYYNSEFKNENLTKKDFESILVSKTMEGEFVNFSEDSSFCFYVAERKAANLDTLVCYVIDKDVFYPATLSKFYTDRVNIYMFNLNDKLVFNANSYSAPTISSPKDVNKLNGTFTYSEKTQLFDSLYTMVITFHKSTWIYLPIIFMLALLVALIANIIFSIINLTKLANNNYKPMININRILNHGQLKYEYDLIEESIRSLVKSNETLKNEISSQRTSTVNYLLMQLITSGFSKDMDFILEQYGIFFEYENFIVATIIPHNYPNSTYNKERFFSELTVGTENLLNNSKHYYITDTDRLILIINASDEPYEMLHRAYISICNLLNELKVHMYFNVNVGLSAVHSSYLQLDAAYMESLQAISYHYSLSPDSGIHMYDNIKNSSYNLNTNFDKTLLAQIKSGDIEKVMFTLTDFFTQLEYIPVKKQSEALYKLSCVLIQVPLLLGLNEKETLNFTKSISQFELMTNISAFKQEITNILSNVIREKLPAGDNDTGNLISVALEYTQQNYKDPALSLTTIASYFGYTPNYFASMFKREYGNTWNNYLNEFRISQAKQFILKGMSVNETYNNCGFTNLRTFNRLFKKIVGCTATEFRTKNKSRSISQKEILQDEK